MNTKLMMKIGLSIIVGAMAFGSFCASLSFADNDLPTIDPTKVPDNVMITFDKANPSDSVNTRMIINAPDKTVMDFSSFNISKDYAVQIILPTYDNGSLASFLARDVGGNASYINGSLNCIGFFTLVNTNGINVGPSANINVGSLVLSTRDITNTNFVNANYIFEKQLDQQTDRLLLNQGTITISKGGFGVLIAGAIENRGVKGVIVCPMGTIALVGGDLVRFDIANNGMLSIAIDKETAAAVLDYNDNPVTAQISNTGTLEANGGTIILKAESLPGLFEKAINMEGYVKADTLENKDGRILIEASGKVDIKAEITASSKITVEAPQIIATSTLSAPMVEVYKTTGDIHVNNVEKVDNLITIEGDGLKVTYMVTSDFTLKSDNAIDTTPGVIMQGNSLTLIARRFGNVASPLTVDTASLRITRTIGDIDITESTGLGTSILICGPPDDGFGQIIYNKSADLQLETLAGGIFLSNNSSLEARNLTIDGSTFNAGNGTIILSGNFSVINGGLFNADTSTVIFIDSSIVSYIIGSNTFYNLTCTTPGKEIVFESGTMTTISGFLTIEGAPDNNVTLSSSKTGEGNEFNIWINGVKDAQGNDYCDYITVNDSNAFGPITPIPAKHEKIGGRNNTDWDPEYTTAQDGNWNDTATWVGGVIPGSGGDTTATANITKKVTVTANQSVLGVTINTGGSLVLKDSNNVEYTLTVGKSGWTDNVGITIAEGTVIFNATTSLLVPAVLTGNTVLNNLTFSASLGNKTFTINNTLTVNGTLTITGASQVIINQGTGAGVIDCKNNITITSANSTLNTGTGVIKMSGTGSQTYTGSTTVGTIIPGAISILTIDKPSGSVTFKNRARITTLNIDATLGGAYDIYIEPCLVPGLTATVAVTGNITFNNIGTLYLGGIIWTATPTNNISLGAVILTADSTIATYGSGTITIASVTDGASSFTLTLQADTASATGAVTFTGNVTIAGITTFAQAYNVVFQGATNTIDNAVTFLNTGTVTFGDNSTDTFLFSGGLTASGPSSVTIGGAVTMGAAATFGSLAINSNALLDMNNNTLTVTTLTSSGTVQDPKSDSTLPATRLAGTFLYTEDALTVLSKLYTTLSLDSTTNDKTFTAAGALDANTLNIGTGDTLDMTAAKDLTVNTTILNSGTVKVDTGVLTLPGTALTNIGSFTFTDTYTGIPVRTYGTLTIYAIGKTVMLGGETTITNLILTAGVFDSDNNNILISGNWTNNGGTFTQGTCKVTMTGASASINGTTTTTFYDLTINTAGTVTDNVGSNVTNKLDVTGTFAIASSKTFTANSSLSSITVNTASTINGAGIFLFNSVATPTITLNGTGTFAPSNVTFSLTSFGGSATCAIPARIYGGTGTFLITSNGNGGTSTFTIGQSASGTLEILGTLTIESTTVGSPHTTAVTNATYNRPIKVAGIWSLSGNSTKTYTKGTETITFNGTTAQTIDGGAGSFYNIQISNTTQTVSLASNTTISGTLTIDLSATFDPKTYTLTVSGAFSNSGNFGITGTKPSGAHTFSGTFTNAAGAVFYATSNTTDITGAADISGTFNENTGTINAVGNMTVQAACTFNKNASGKIVFNKGDATQTLTTNSKDLGNIQISAGAGATTLTLRGALTCDNLTIDASQTLDMGVNTLTVNTTLANLGTVKDPKSDSTILATSNMGTFEYAALAATIVKFTPDYSTLKLSGAATYTVSGTGILTTGTLNISNASAILDMNNKTLTVTTLTNSGTIQDPKSDSTLPATRLAGTFLYTENALTVLSKLYTTLSLDSTTNDKTFTAAGTLDANTLNIGTGDTLDMGVNTLTVNTTLANLGTVKDPKSDSTILATSNMGTFEYTSTRTIPNFGINYSTLKLNGVGQTFTLGGNTTLTNMNIASGTLNSGGFDINISGNWADTGTFTPSTGTVTFTGNGAISGDTIFNNLTCETAGNTLTFKNGSTQTINGAMTLKGSLGNLLTLKSDSTGTKWNIYPKLTVSVDYLNVSDSNNMGDAIYTPTSTVTNSINWYGASRPNPNPTPQPVNPDHATYETSVLANAVEQAITNIQQYNEASIARVNTFIDSIKHIIQLPHNQAMSVMMRDGKVYLV